MRTMVPLWGVEGGRGASRYAGGGTNVRDVFFAGEVRRVASFSSDFLNYGRRLTPSSAIDVNGLFLGSAIVGGEFVGFWSGHDGDCGKE